jgi:hypothetical protein
LEDREMAGHFAKLCGKLYAGRACAYNGNTLSCQVQLFLRPVRRVEQGP